MYSYDKINVNDLSSDFKDVIKHCIDNQLFIGEGNPNAKILIIGKEIGGSNPKTIDDIVNNSNYDIQRNIESWTNHAGYQLHAIKTDVFNHGRNPTWTNYQKLISQIINHDLGRDNYDFLDYCFITEMSDIHIPRSNFSDTLSTNEHRQLGKLRIESIQKRTELFKMQFFQKFPIVIIACGNYVKDFKIDIESIFDVKCAGKTNVISKGNFYTKYCKQFKVVIHTRQMSSGISNKLISEIAHACQLGLYSD